MLNFDLSEVSPQLGVYVSQGKSNRLHNNGNSYSQPPSSFYQGLSSLNSQFFHLVGPNAASLPDDFGVRVKENIGRVLADAQFRSNYGYMVNDTDAFASLLAHEGQDGLVQNSDRLIVERSLHILGLDTTIDHYQVSDHLEMDEQQNFLAHLDDLIRFTLQGIYRREVINAGDMNKASVPTLILARLYNDPNDKLEYDRNLFNQLGTVAMNESLSPRIKIAAVKLMNHMDFSECPEADKKMVEQRLFHVVCNEPCPLLMNLGLMAMANLVDTGYQLTRFKAMDGKWVAKDSDHTKALRDFIAYMLNPQEFTAADRSFDNPGSWQRPDYSAQPLQKGLSLHNQLTTALKWSDNFAPKAAIYLGKSLEPFSSFYSRTIDEIEELYRQVSRQEKPYEENLAIITDRADSLIARSLGERLENYKGIKGAAKIAIGTVNQVLGEWNDSTFNRNKEGLAIIVDSLLSHGWDIAARRRKLAEDLQREGDQFRSRSDMQVASVDKILMRLQELEILARQRRGEEYHYGEF